MSKYLALLSGKGGSGKTTLALSISSMLSSCGIKVLLIDCDLCTNGATYFYESKLNENKYSLNSFRDVLNGNINEKINYLSINKCFDFLPSISKITNDDIMTYSYDYEGTKNIRKFKNIINNQYDVIIYDCQAGYTDVLQIMLPYTDTNLFVMETDAISSASIRSLYLKIGNMINDKKVYQIFNKATQEEYNTYSKISGGTVFTNIETVIFDWRIRKAFSVAQIPDMENTSANYGEQVFNICNILFTEEIIQKKLNQFKIIIEINKKTEDEKIINEKIEEIHRNNKLLMNKRYKTLFSFATLLSSAFLCVIFYEMIDSQIFNFNSSNKFLMILMASFIIITIFLILYAMLEITKENREQYQKIIDYRTTSINLNKEINELRKNFSDLKERNQLD